MAFKFLAFAAFIAAANAGVINTYGAAQYAAPLAYAPVAKYAAPVLAKTVVPEPYDPHPQYQFSYGINDQVTGDHKDQQEQRDGDVVQGSYSLIDADGYKRTVQYTADPIHGFNAVVHREPLGAPVVAKVAAPVAYAAPFAKVAAPLAYASPVAKYAAPLGYAAAPAYYH